MSFPLQESSSFRLKSERDYHSLFELARGGIGCVTLVVKRDAAFERLYAMKTLQPHYRTDDSVRGMFLEEARIAGLVRHPNVVSVIDVGEGPEGPFLVMEYIEGLSLSQVISSELTEGHLPVGFCAEVMRQVAEGLHAAHELVTNEGQPLHIVHRDVSPQNILLGFDGVARVVDFGIAKALGAKAQTSTGILKGKLGYMAPEQLRFLKPDRRTDLYALGVVLFEMLSRKRLYSGGLDSEVPQQILSGPVPDINDYRGDVPPELVSLLFDLLAKDPDNRPSNARRVAERLQEVIDADPSISIQAFLNQNFASRKTAAQARVKEALETERSDAALQREDRASEKARRPIALALMGLALLVSLLAFFAFWLGGGSEEADLSVEQPALPLPTELEEPGTSEVGIGVQSDLEAEQAGETAVDSPPRPERSPVQPGRSPMRTLTTREASEPPPSQPNSAPMTPAMGQSGRPEGWWGWESE